MLINLYEDPDVKRESPKIASRVYIKQPSGVDPRVWGSLEMPMAVREYFDNLFSVTDRYVSLRDLQYDVMLPVELLCVGRNAKKYCVHLDLRERLDLVLSSLCGVNPEQVRAIPNYLELSRTLLDAAIMEVPESLTLEPLLNIEEVQKYFVDSGFHYQPKGFLSSVLLRSQDIVWYVSSYLCMRCIAKRQSAIRSIRPAESVVFTNELIGTSVDIQTGGFVVPVALASYKPFDYLKEVRL